MTQSVQQVAKVRFSKEQLAEIAQFERDLKAGKANIIFTGTFEEGIQFLKDTGDVVDASITHKFIISFWKLDKFLKTWVLEDIADIRRNADIIEEFENIEILDEYDNSIVVPEHMVTYKIDHDLEKVYIININPKGIEQKLNGYRS